MKFRHGDIVRLSSRRSNAFCVALMVSKNDIKRGVNALRPGIHLFRGYWYGKNPLSIKGFGKIEGPANKMTGSFVTRVESHKQVKRMGV